MAMSCSNCFFWVTVSGRVSVSGECRRMPPQIVLGELGDVGVGGRLAVFPITSSGTWCGGYQDLQNPWSQQMMQNIGR